MVDERGFNAINRGVYIADNLDFLRSLNDECVDLVCIDPPFKKNQTFTGEKLKPTLSVLEKEIEQELLRRWGIDDAHHAETAGIQWPDDSRVRGGYKDIWSWEEDVHEVWLQTLEEEHEPVANVIEATRYVHGESTAAYLCFMAIRLVEMHRVLKPTGSLYLHCDRDANSYIRLVLDGIFGKSNFRNEIVWCYPPGGGGPKLGFHAKHDTIYYYGKSGVGTFNRPYRPLTDRQKAKFTEKDDAGKRFKQYTNGRAYLDDAKGSAVPDWWTDIHSLGQTLSKEFTGYPTQKPHTLAARIIEASTHPGNVVLDCFAGCAYTAVAAEKTGRRWIACDINPRAWTMFKRQFNNPKLGLNLDCDEASPDQQSFTVGPVVTVRGPNELPKRTTPDKPVQLKVREVKERKFKVPVSVIPDKQMLIQLLELSGYQAWCCGFANRMPSGKVIRTTDNFELDHIDPKSKDGSNDITNRAPLCPAHNSRKSNRRVSLDDYRIEIADAGEMKVDTIDDLVSLPEIRRTVDLIYSRALTAAYPDGAK